ncbi:hypothetical protein [Candidatus Palauibacter sp.]|uniref:hypothetical protein n=1 Tax=Candidatus Palauibacter sp. TaxID=3101350 RepID=UPI003B01AD94
MDPRDKTYSVVVFPFLKTSKPVSLGSLELRSTDDLDGLTEDQAASVSEIADMLFAMGNQRIKRASYAIVDRIDLGSWSTPETLSPIGDVEAVIAYLYANPRYESNSIFLSPEHTNSVVLTPSRVDPGLVRSRYNVVDVTHETDREPDSIESFDGYDCVFGLQHYFWVAPGSRVYGTTPRPILNISQDLAIDVERGRARVDYRHLFKLLIVPGRYGDLGQRAFKAVRWFNRANSEHRNEAESFICLAVALETLLGLPKDAKTDRFVDAIALLLGRVPRLAEWAAQFYDARSRAVHEGNVGPAAFIPLRNSNKQTTDATYQSLLAYGREVFQLCLGTTLTGAALSSYADLEAKLISNAERYTTVCKTLNDDSLPLNARLEQLRWLASSIERYRYVPDTGLATPAMLGACRAAARAVLGCDVEIAEELRDALEALIDAPRTDSHFEQLDALRALVYQLRELPDATTAPELGGMVTLVKTTWSYEHMYYFSIRRDADV